MKRYVWILGLMACAAPQNAVKRSDGSKKAAAIEEFVQDMVARPGLVPLYYEPKRGRLYLEVPAFDQPMLYLTWLSHGVGSNDLGMDRGRLTGERVVRFVRRGSRALLVQDNLQFRADSDDPAERAAVEQAFARSVLWAFEVIVDDGARVLVDATDMVISDANRLGPSLDRMKQGGYTADAKRSAVIFERTKSFPRNTEIQTLLTLALSSGRPGDHVRSVTPDPAAITVEQRHSFVALPDAEYRPRRSDPRAGFFEVSYRDYAAPLTAPVDKHLIARHRLSGGSKAGRIVYYVDRGAPEPIRSALMDGARWWTKAFEAAGHPGAFEVQLMPEGADPLDVRYNVIQWVHRSTRGWSYGGSVVDPRTGEIIKGHVTLGSLRVRQDMLLAEGLLGVHRGAPGGEAIQGMALARLRQLSAHEVGHTLGLRHNFAGSTGFGSVMDYPHPLARIVAATGEVDLSKAYEVGVGAWDTFAIRYGYSEPKSGGSEAAHLAELIAWAEQRGLRLLSDEDARPRGGAHPQAHLWDNGRDATLGLAHVLDVRARALARLSERAVGEGEPLANLHDVLVPTYAMHRYAVEAAVKQIGGFEYTHVAKGGIVRPVEPLPAPEQERAMQVLLRTLQLEVLELPGALLSKIPPSPPGRHDRALERFSGRTAMLLDPAAIAEAAAQHTVSLLLEPARLERLWAQQRLAWMLDALIDATVLADPERAPLLETDVASAVLVNELIRRVRDPSVSSGVRAWLQDRLDRVAAQLQRRARGTKVEQSRVHARHLADQIRRLREAPETLVLPNPIALPPGSPIGACGG